jgi:hypothetical protein
MLDGRVTGERRAVSDFELKIYARAGLTAEEAQQWADAGIGPYQAGGYRSAGLTLEDAQRCWQAGISGTEAAATEQGALLARVDATLGHLAPLEEQHPGLTPALGPGQARRIEAALLQGLTVEQAGAWISAGGPTDDMYDWVRSGAHPREARRMSEQGFGPPAAGVAARYGTAGFTLEEAWPWLQRSIPPRRARAYRRLGITPREAATFYAAGITPERAGQIIAAGHHRRLTTPEPSGCGAAPWTFDELASRRVAELRRILQQDLLVAPAGETPELLRDQILAVQSAFERRGTVRWINNGADEVILYESRTARDAVRMVAQLEKISCWRDLQRLVRRGAPAGRVALEHLWDEWCGNLSADSTHPGAVSCAGDLLDVMRGEAEVHVTNRGDDGIFRFVDPYDPLQMGVSILVVERYGVERSNLVAFRKVLLRRDLACIGATLGALGWALRRGAERDLAGLR